MNELTWTPDTARLDSLELWARNPKRMSKARAARLRENWKDLKQWQTLAVGPNGEVYDGHQRIKTLQAAGYAGDYEILVLRSSRPLTDAERERIIIEGTVGAVGVLDWDALAGWDASALQGYGLDAEALAEWNDAAANLASLLEAAAVEEDLPEETLAIKPKEMARVLVSIPVDEAANAREILDRLNSIPGIEILYSGN